MPSITNEVQLKRASLMNKVLKSFSLLDFNDQTEITFETARSAYSSVLKLEDDIKAVFPKRNTSRLRKGVHRKDLDTIRVLREMLRYYNMTLMYTRKQTKSGCIYKYKIAK